MSTEPEKKIDEEKISDVEEKKSDAEEKNFDVEKKNSDDKKILDSINEDGFKSKIGNFFDGISLKYILTVAGGALFCVLVIGAVLFFADSYTTEPIKRDIAAVEEEKRVHVKITGGMSTGEIADQLEEKGVINSS